MKIKGRARSLLLKAVAAIKKYPETFRMEGWSTHSHLKNSDVPRRPRPYCGAVACLAGHITIHLGIKPGTESMTVRRLPKALRPIVIKHFTGSGEWLLQHLDHGDVAAAALGLDYHEARSLWYVEAWPQQYADRYNNAEIEGDKKGMARAVEGRVKYFIRTRR
jgi:hypothetical protein